MGRLIGLIVVIAVLYAMYRYMGASKSMTPDAVDQRNQPLPALGPADYEEAAAIADGPDRGFGILRVTPSQLIFAGNSGRFVAIERLDITGVTTTTDLPDHVTAKPVLAVAAGGEVHYFAVEDAAAWERRLL